MFSPVYFSFSDLCQLEWLSHLQQSPVPLQFPFPDVIIAIDATPTHWAFYYQGSSLPLSVSVFWSGSMCRAHIALQELQAVTMMLHRMAFYLSGKVVALHLGNSTAKAYLCNQGGTVSLTCQILSLTDRHGITLMQHTFLPISMWRSIICPRVSCFWRGIFSLRWLKQLFAFGVYQRWICWHPPIPLNASIITSWKLWGPWG